MLDVLGRVPLHAVEHQPALALHLPPQRIFGVEQVLDQRLAAFLLAPHVPVDHAPDHGVELGSGHRSNFFNAFSAW